MTYIEKPLSAFREIQTWINQVVHEHKCDGADCEVCPCRICLVEASGDYSPRDWVDEELSGPEGQYE